LRADRWRGSLLLALGLASAALAPAERAHAARIPPAPPDVLLPKNGATRVDPSDVHIVCSAFDGSVFAPHRSTDVEIIDGATVVWRARVGPVTHVHLGDGEFLEDLEGASALAGGRAYRVRARYEDADRVWGAWTNPTPSFRTRGVTAPSALLISRILSLEANDWRTQAGDAVVLAPESGAELRLEVNGVGRGEIRASSGAVLYTNEIEPGPLRVRLRASGSLAIPASQLEFLTGPSAELRRVYLPAIDFPVGGACSFWVDQAGATWSAIESDREPVWGERMGFAPLPWSASAGYKVERVASDVNAPVNIAFVPNPGDVPDAPVAYFTQLYDGISALLRDGTTRIVAHGLLNYDPGDSFGESAENGVLGLAVAPQGEALLATLVYRRDEILYNRLLRLDLSEDGLAIADTASLLAGVRSGFAHQIQFVVFGADEKLYVGIGDGRTPVDSLNPAQDPRDLRGKILRLNLDGSTPSDNPTPGSPVFALGLRNPFGAALRPGTGELYASDNGKEKDDRILRVEGGVNYGWPDSVAFRETASFVWRETVAPTAIAFAPESTTVGIPGRLYVALSGSPSLNAGRNRGKAIVELRFEGDSLVHADTVVTYTGGGFSNIVGLAFGPDGLYWTDLFGEEGFDGTLRSPGAIYRLVRESAPLEPPCSTSRLGDAATFRLARNPAPGALGFRADLEGSAPLEIKLFDASGRCVSSERFDSVGPGVVEMSVGSELPSGIFFYRVRVGEQEHSGKAILVK
jgi:glucose/arabinose dehydrogenase